MADDILMRDRVGQRPNILDQMAQKLNERPKLVEPPEQEADRLELAKKCDPLPESPAERYRPHAGFINRLHSEQRTFHCVMADLSYRGFPYASYDGIELKPGDKPGSGLDVVVRFTGGDGLTLVTLSGRNLRFIYNCIGLGILPWVWELPEGQHVEGDSATVITSIRIETRER